METVRQTKTNVIGDVACVVTEHATEVYIRYAPPEEFTMQADMAALVSRYKVFLVTTMSFQVIDAASGVVEEVLGLGRIYDPFNHIGFRQGVIVWRLRRPWMRGNAISFLNYRILL